MNFTAPLLNFRVINRHSAGGSFSVSVDKRSLKATMNLTAVAWNFAALCNLILVAHGYTNKYSEKVNKAETGNIEDELKQIRPFRMKTTNHLWTTARKQKHLNIEQTSELYRDLEKLDRLAIRMKKLRSEDGDQDGLVEAKVLYKFKAIADKYSLNEDESQDNNVSHDINNTDPDKDLVHFEDFKLRQLWTQAKTSGFSEEDLALLQQEFTHQQMKIDQFQLLHNEALDIYDPEDNSVYLENDQDLDPSMNDESKDRLIVKQRDRLAIQEGFSHLERLTVTLSPISGEFKDARVNSLWELARKSNWTIKEMDSFKLELNHFEKRLSKLKVYTEQLLVSRQKPEHKRNLESYAFLEEKKKILDKEIKKYHSGLKEKLSTAINHLEL